MDFEKQVRNGFFGVTPGERVALGQGQNESGCETDILSATDYPELEDTQLDAYFKLSGGSKIYPGQCHGLDYSGIDQGIPTSYNFSRLDTNEHIRSVHGFHTVAYGEREGLKNSRIVPGDQIEQVEWTLRSGEFQFLDRVISSHLRRESRMSDDTAAASLVHLGQISLRFPDPSSEANLGPRISQSASSASEIQVNWETSYVQVPNRTRNGTPPLLFGALNRPKNDADWEIVGNGNEITRIADIWESTSGRPFGTLPLIPPGKALRHPAHPRYTYFWDLQQDLRSGAFVLIPCYEKLYGVSSFSNQNALKPLTLRGAQNNYSHPTLLTSSHRHPLAARDQPIGTVNSQNQLHFQSSSAWHSTAATHFGPLSPLPRKDPSRLTSQQPEFDFGLQSRDNNKIDQILAMGEGSIDHGRAIPSAIVPTSPISETVLEGHDSSPRLTSLHRHLEGTANQNQPGEEGHGRYPLDGAAIHDNSAAPSPVFALADPERSFSPVHRDWAGTARARDFGTAEQARHIRSRSPNRTHTDIEMQTITSPVGAYASIPRPSAAHMTPRWWMPIPHPLGHLSGPRQESPHLRHLPQPQATSSSPCPSPGSQQQLVSRYYLIVCAFLPLLLVPYSLGMLNWIIRLHTGGRCREMGRYDKQMALLIFYAELFVLAVFALFFFIL
ncbi:MAG: hypothetical protein Q9182_007567 [Xanthomendoza sp. 2 TL-2023]